jgi:uncharacterized protein
VFVQSVAEGKGVVAAKAPPHPFCLVSAARAATSARVQKVLITGGTGFVGRRLVERLLDRGDHVTVLTRDAAKARHHFPERVRCAAWDPAKPGAWTEELSVVSAVVNLAGEPVAQRWSDAARDRITKSRIDATRVLVEAMGKAKPHPSVLVCASAIGFYGPRPPEEQLDETSDAGHGFLADLAQRWEEAARAAEPLGIRSVQIRLGVVLGEGGGALDKMILPFKLFAGGPVGDGTQVVSWVSREDVVGMILLALDDARLTGPINAVSPNPVTSKEMADALGVVLGRPSWLKTPAFAVNAAMGEAASILTTGQRVFPRKAVDLGYEFQQARLLPALESILGDR